MKMRMLQKLNSSGGVSVLIVVLLLAAGALAVIAVFFPSLLGFGGDVGDLGCAIALRSAQRKVDESDILAQGTLSREAAMEEATQRITDFYGLCPSGGEIYLERDATGGRYEIICGLHNTDTLRRARLNAERLLERLRAQSAKAALRGEALPEELELELNSKPVTVRLVTQETGLKRGTYTTPGYEGTVAFYMLEDGECSYFCFADENHAVTWRRGLGWDYDA